MSNINNINYYNKYLKYKRKYLNLQEVKLKNSKKLISKNNSNTIKGVSNKQIMDEKPKYDFYVYHSTIDSTPKTITNILLDGYILAGKHLSVKYRKFKGDEPCDYIFANLYYEDIKTIPGAWGYSALILHPKIVYDLGMVFNKGWIAGPGSSEYSIYFEPTDTVETINKKLDKIRELLKHPESYLNENLMKLFKGQPQYYHEVLFKDRIKIEDYLVGIVCTGCDKKDILKFKKLLKNYNLENIPIYTTYSMPKVEDLIKDF